MGQQQDKPQTMPSILPLTSVSLPSMLTTWGSKLWWKGLASTLRRPFWKTTTFRKNQRTESKWKNQANSQSCLASFCLKEEFVFLYQINIYLIFFIYTIWYIFTRLLLLFISFILIQLLSTLIFIWIKVHGPNWRKTADKTNWNIQFECTVYWYTYNIEVFFTYPKSYHFNTALCTKKALHFCYFDTWFFPNLYKASVCLSFSLVG